MYNFSFQHMDKFKYTMKFKWFLNVSVNLPLPILLNVLFVLHYYSDLSFPLALINAFM